MAHRDKPLQFTDLGSCHVLTGKYNYVASILQQGSVELSHFIHSDTFELRDAHTIGFHWIQFVIHKTRRQIFTFHYHYTSIYNSSTVCQPRQLNEWSGTRTIISTPHAKSTVTAFAEDLLIPFVADASCCRRSRFSISKTIPYNLLPKQHHG